MYLENILVSFILFCGSLMLKNPDNKNIYEVIDIIGVLSFFYFMIYVIAELKILFRNHNLN